VDDEEAVTQAIAVVLKSSPDTSAAYDRAQAFSKQRCIMAYGALIESLVKNAAAAPLSNGKRLIRKIADIALHENWMIGWVDEPIANALRWKTCPKVNWIGARSKKRYFADPFAWPGKPGTVLCEEYDFALRLGRLKRLTLNGGRIASEAEVSLPLPGHLSFPYLFEHVGETYLIPESCHARKLAIFKYGNEGFELFATPFEDIAAGDSVLFRHNGFFWIAYTDTVLNPFDNLNLCYAESMAGPWKAHPGNPVKRGLTNSRCAGTLFTVKGELFRPAQDCTNTYGGAIRILRVTECTPEHFAEEEVNLILPHQGLNPHGFHTLSAWGNRCLVDGKRLLFSPRRVLAKLRRRSDDLTMSPSNS
jgi:hypothetical protein